MPATRKRTEDAIVRTGTEINECKHTHTHPHTLSLSLYQMPRLLRQAYCRCKEQKSPLQKNNERSKLFICWRCSSDWPHVCVIQPVAALDVLVEPRSCVHQELTTALRENGLWAPNSESEREKWICIRQVARNPSANERWCCTLTAG